VGVDVVLVSGGGDAWLWCVVVSGWRKGGDEYGSGQLSCERAATI